MDPVVHFEMPAEDKKRMIKFYESVFGWQTQQLGPEFGDYVVVTTTETDENQMIKTPGNINGGFYEKQPTDTHGQHPRIVIAVEDIRASMKQVEAAGGKIIGGGFQAGEPDDIPGVGLYISVLDPEGNEVALLQPVSRA